MKRLILATGRWSTILSVAYLNSREDNQKSDENTLIHISHIADENYLSSFEKFAYGTRKFTTVKSVNYCVYRHATLDNRTNGDLEEKSNDEAELLLRNLLENDEFDEIIVPHLFSPKSRMLLSMYPTAKAYCIEEGLNSYFRHYSKTNLNDNEKYFLSRLSGYISFNFMGLAPLFDYSKYGIPVITPDTQFVRELIEVDPSEHQNLEVSGINPVMFIGQFARPDMPMQELLNHYISSISSIIHYGMTVHFVKHPRDSTQLVELLEEAFAGQDFHILNMPDFPAESIASMANWCAVVSYASSALVTIPTMYKIPAFTIDEFDLEALSPAKGDFGNGRNLVGAVIPRLRLLVERLQVEPGDPAGIANSVFSSFKGKQHIIKKIYSQKSATDNYPVYTLLTQSSLNQRIKSQPFNAALWRAKSSMESSYKRSVIFAWRAFVLDPTKKDSYANLIYRVFAAKRTLNPEIVTQERDILRKAENEPISLPALMGYAYILQKRGELRRSAMYVLRALISRPYHPGFYVLAFNWARNLAKVKVRDKPRGVIFHILFDMSLIRVSRKARRLKHTDRNVGSKIAALTYRPNRGATGGPGGVLALQKTILGSYYGDRSIEYVFRRREDYTDWFADIASGANFSLEACATGKYRYYFAHDLGSAYGLALANADYILEWHFQGSLVTQLLNFGEKMDQSLIGKLKDIEAFTMKKAKYVIFPSDGARDMYASDTNRGCDIDDIHVGASIYNTILPGAARPGETGSCVPSFDGLTFTSVGTLTWAKGQDRVLDFFEQMMPHQTSRIRWILIGKGVMKKELIDRANELSERFEGFEFTYIERIPHREVMSVLRLSDIYIMLHRISIFDFATLEAMKNSCAIVLSKAGGNIDFNKSDNILFAEDIEFSDSFTFSKSNIDRLKVKNQEVLNKHFSVQNFKNQNFEALDALTSEKMCDGKLPKCADAERCK